MQWYPRRRGERVEKDGEWFLFKAKIKLLLLCIIITITIIMFFLLFLFLFIYIYIHISSATGAWFISRSSAVASWDDQTPICS